MHFHSENTHFRLSHSRLHLRRKATQALVKSVRTIRAVVNKVTHLFSRHSDSGAEINDGDATVADTDFSVVVPQNSSAVVSGTTTVPPTTLFVENECLPLDDHKKTTPSPTYSTINISNNVTFEKKQVITLPASQMTSKSISGVFKKIKQSVSSPLLISNYWNKRIVNATEDSKTESFYDTELSSVSNDSKSTIGAGSDTDVTIATKASLSAADAKVAKSVSFDTETTVLCSQNCQISLTAESKDSIVRSLDYYPDLTPDTNFQKDPLNSILSSIRGLLSFALSSSEYCKYETDISDFAYYPFDFSEPTSDAPKRPIIGKFSTHLLHYRCMKDCVFYPPLRSISKEETTDSTDDDICKLLSSIISEEDSTEVTHGAIAKRDSCQTASYFLESSIDSVVGNGTIRASTIANDKSADVTESSEIAESSKGLTTITTELETDGTTNIKENVPVSIDPLSMNIWERRKLQSQSPALARISNYKLATKLVRQLKKDLPKAFKVKEQIKNAENLRKIYKDSLNYTVNSLIVVPEVDNTLFITIGKNADLLEKIWFTGLIPEENDSSIQSLLHSALVAMDWHMTITNMLTENGYTAELIKKLNTYSRPHRNQTQGFKRPPCRPLLVINKQLLKVKQMD